MSEFRTQLIRFLDELIEQFPDESDFVIMRIFLKDQIPVSDVIGRFIRDVLPLKDKVKNRDETFFLENVLLYIPESTSSSLSYVESRVSHLKKLWLSDKLTSEDRETLWKWIDIFIQIADIYHKKFGPVPSWE